MKYKNQSHSRLLVDGLDTFSEILSCIEKAQKTIRMNVFMWRNDASGRRILSALSAKIQKCPHIKIYIRKDNFGARVYNLQKLISFGKIGGDIFSSQIGKEFLKNTKNIIFSTIGSSSLIFFKYLKENDHSKLFLFDEHTPDTKAIIGGMNISDEYLLPVNHDDPENGGWHDYMVILYGKAADRIAIHRVEEKKKWFVRKIREGAEILMDIQNKHLIRQEILREISHAKKSIIIEHAYFTDSMIIRRLRRLSKSGVKVIVIMPNRSDGVWHANMQSVQKLLSPDLSTGSTNENIEVYLYQGMIHAKVIVIDDTTAILGSANLTYGSFDLLHETNALFRGSESVVKSLISQIQKDMNYCTRVTLNTLPDYNRWIAWFQRIFI